MMTLLLSLTLLVAIDSLAATITIDPVSQIVSLGGPASIDVNVSGLGNLVAPSLGTYDLDIFFDPALLSFSSIIWGTGLDVLDLGSIQSATPAVGMINAFALSLDSPTELNSLQPGAFRLFRLTFSTVAEGVSAITVNVNALGDAAGVALTTDITNGLVTVEAGASNVPEPSDTWIVFIAFALGLHRVRQHRAS